MSIRKGVYNGTMEGAKEREGKGRVLESTTGGEGTRGGEQSVRERRAAHLTD